MPQSDDLSRVAKYFKRGFLGLVSAAAIFLAYVLLQLNFNPLNPGQLKTDDKGRTNVLILGIGDAGHDGAQLSDTNLVVSLDKTSRSTAMISVPRDLRVNIPDYYPAKINLANSLGGSVLASRIVGDTLNLPIHYYLQADFSALKEAVDIVGGIDVTVKDRLYDPEYPCDEDQYRSCGLDIKPGIYHMDGSMALAYTRCRKGTCGSDFGRSKRQQEMLKLVKTKLTTPSVMLNPWRITGLIKIWRMHVSTNMSVNNVIHLVWKMGHSSKTYNLVLDDSPGGYLKEAPGGSDLLPVGGNFSRIQAAANNIFTNKPE